MHRLAWLGILAVCYPAWAVPISDLSSANNRFAIALLHELSGSASGNLVVSPLSLETALGMTYAGAKGETAAQMADVLEIETLGEQVHQAHADLARSLKTTCTAGESAKLSIANAIWSVECQFKPAYADLVQADYSAEARTLNGTPEAMAAQINDWASQHTNQKIERAVDAADLQGELAAVLTNAVYFLGKWEHPFDKSLTTNREFTLSDRTSIDVPMMSTTIKSPPSYLETEDFQLLELPYKSSTAVMDIFLPRAHNGLDQLERAFNNDSLTYWLAFMASATSDVQLSMPKLTTRATYHLKPALSKLGMPVAFGDADFSGMLDCRAWISDVIHSVYLQVDETGTEAAATTVMPMALSMPPSRIPFECDHPFLFLIRDTATNTILFIGHIMDPRK